MRDAFAKNSLDLLHYFERRVDPREDAADLLSDTMLIAWRKVGALPSEPESARMWLFVTARNTLSNYRRGKRRQLELATALRHKLAETQLAETGDSTDAARDVVDVVNRLPRELGEFIRLVHWDHFSVDEASRLMGLSRATGRRRYNRAMDEVRQMLELPPQPDSSPAGLDSAGFAAASSAEMND